MSNQEEKKKTPKRQLRHLYHPGHYKEVANTLASRRPEKQDCHYEYWLSVVHTFAHDFAQDNENFRRGRFLRDCGAK